MNTSTIKIEPKWDHSEVQQYSGNTLTHKWDKLVPTVVQKGKKNIKKNEECVMDSSYQIYSTILDR